MFSTTTTQLDTNTIKYQLFENTLPMSYQAVIKAWQNNSTFRAFFNQLLIDSPFKGLFWECPPVTKKNRSQAFEFVLINGPSFTSLSPNSRAFQQFFDQKKSVVSFANLSGDAQLVVPCPVVENQHYTHLAAFVRNAKTEQIEEFWKLVGKTVEKRINSKTMWLSTAGMGVYWLHVRLDSRPKYYKHRPYREGGENEEEKKF